RHRRRTGGSLVRPACDVEGGRPGSRPLDQRLDCRSTRWPGLAALSRGRCNGIPVFIAARSSGIAVTTSSPTVFVVDDHAAVREALGEMLGVFGYAVKTYPSADAFLRSLDRQGAGCIVADVRMPGTDGISLVRELARRHVVLPVILISGHADVPMAVAAIKAGAEDFIEKPVDDTQLVAAINRALARRLEQQDHHKSQGVLGDRFARLTPRQVEIFDLVVEGFPSHAISVRLNLSVRAVERYRSEVMEKIQPERRA